MEPAPVRARWIRLDATAAPDMVDLADCGSLVGPFAFQANNDTRRFEYPWACETLAPARGLSVLEMGRETEAHWPLNPRRFSLLSRRFGTSVTLKHGERPELYGFREFDAGRILAQKDMYNVGRGRPVRVQTLVLAKPR